MALPRLHQQPVRGFLASVDVAPRIIVRFQFNPVEVSDRRGVTFTALSAPGLLLPVHHYVQGGDRTLTFKVRVDALADTPTPIELSDDGGIGPELNKYRSFVWPRTSRWREAGASFLPLYDATSEFTAPPECRFGMGERIVDCVVTDVSINELAFTPELSPLRADVSVTLQEIRPYAAAGAGTVA